MTSDFRSPGTVYYKSPRTCADGLSPARIELGSLIDLGAEKVRIGLGVANFCRFYGSCSGISNTTPWYDNVRFGVYGLPDAPYLAAGAVDLPQDAFPENGTLSPSAPGRVDCNHVKGAATPESYTSLGDTLIVSGGSGGAEVRVVFAVVPGPGIDAGRLTAWLGRHRPEGPWRGLDWVSARMDTAEQGGSVAAGEWMTAYHEEDPNFTGTDRDLDPADLDPLGREGRLANDIFPDDLLTPGTRLCLYYETRFLAGSTWYTDPDTAGGNYYEMEVLPSSMAADGTFNCTLYVDHDDGRGAQPFVESGLRAALPGGSDNFENVPWDRWDVRAPAGAQGSFGRPDHTAYGATLLQAMGYRTVIWNSGNLQGSQLVKEDAEVLIPWLYGDGSRNLYLSGDGLAQGMATDTGEGTGPASLLDRYCGVGFTCGTVRDPACGTGGIADSTACLSLDPATGARVAGSLGRAAGHLAQGNGCREFRSFDLLAPSGAAAGSAEGDERYVGGAKTGSFASVSHDVTGDAGWRTVVDGLSVHYRRDAGGACAYLTPAYPDEPAVDERLAEVLAWFGTSGQSCDNSQPITGLPPAGSSAPRWGLRLLGAQPVVRGGPARFELSVPAGETASLAVFDVAGRRVATVFAGRGLEGPVTAAWDLRDGSGRRVPAGIYFARLQGTETRVRRLVVLP